MRADARRNRDRIVAIAAEALARDGGTSLSAIGKLAGVGQGTLYRHFPDREALIWAVAEREVAALAADADRLLAEGSPRAALRAWMLLLARFMRDRARLNGTMAEPRSLEEKRSRPGFIHIEAAVDSLLAANRAAGTVRADVTTRDFTDLAGVFRLVVPHDEEERAERLVDLILIAISNCANTEQK